MNEQEINLKKSAVSYALERGVDSADLCKATMKIQGGDIVISGLNLVKARHVLGALFEQSALINDQTTGVAIRHDYTSRLSYNNPGEAYMLAGRADALREEGHGARYMGASADDSYKEVSCAVTKVEFTGPPENGTADVGFDTRTGTLSIAADKVTMQPFKQAFRTGGDWLKHAFTLVAKAVAGPEAADMLRQDIDQLAAIKGPLPTQLVEKTKADIEQAQVSRVFDPAEINHIVMKLTGKNLDISTP